MRKEVTESRVLASLLAYATPKETDTLTDPGGLLRRCGLWWICEHCSAECSPLLARCGCGKLRTETQIPERWRGMAIGPKARAAILWAVKHAGRRVRFGGTSAYPTAFVEGVYFDGRILFGQASEAAIAGAVRDHPTFIWLVDVPRYGGVARLDQLTLLPEAP